MLERQHRHAVGEYPHTIDGTPFSRSAAYLTTEAIPLPLNSARYTPPRNPIGTPIKDASNSTLPLPTIALAMPPPVSPTGFGSFVKNAQLIDVPPLKTRYPYMQDSTNTETSAHTPVIASMKLLTNLRQRSLRFIRRSPHCPFVSSR